MKKAIILGLLMYSLICLFSFTVFAETYQGDEPAGTYSGTLSLIHWSASDYQNYTGKTSSTPVVAFTSEVVLTFYKRGFTSETEFIVRADLNGDHYNDPDGINLPTDPATTVRWHSQTHASYQQPEGPEPSFQLGLTDEPWRDGYITIRAWTLYDDVLGDYKVFFRAEMLYLNSFQRTSIVSIQQGYLNRTANGNAVYYEGDGPYAPQSTHTVTFDSKGGSLVSSKTVNHNAVVTRPVDPQRSGYTFAYWYTTDINTPYSFTTPVTSNITLNAKWQDQSNPDDNDTCNPVDTSSAIPVYAGVTFTRGNNTYIKNSDCTTGRIKRNQQFTNGDLLRTGSGEDDVMEISLGGGGEFTTVGGEPFFRMRRLSIWTVEPDENKVTFKISKGQAMFRDMTSKFKQLYNDDEIIIETGGAAMSIRGTELYIYVLENGDTTVYVTHGSVLVKDLFGGEQTLLAGQKINVTVDDGLEYTAFITDADYDDFDLFEAEEDSNFIWTVIVILLIISPFVLLILFFKFIKRKLKPKKAV